MLVPNKHGTSRDYRFGFNGKEKDDELKGEGNSIDYEARMHDTRVGRFLSRDPLGKQFPWYTPYQFAGNTPIWAVDLDGKEEYFYQLTLSKNNKGEPILLVAFAKEINYKLIPDSIEPDHFRIRDLDGSLLEFDFDTKKELFKNILGKNIQQIRNASKKELEKTEKKAIEGITSMVMFQTIGDIENGAMNHNFGSENDEAEQFDELAEGQAFSGATDYSTIKNPKNLNASTKPTPRQVREMKKLNREQNGGILRDDVTGERMVDSKKSTTGVTPPSNEVQVDHVRSVKNGGTREVKNLQLRTRKNNRIKWHH